MTWQPEMEMIDQLLGGDVSLTIVAKLFRDESRARHALLRYLENGIVELKRNDEVLARWQSLQLLRQAPQLADCADVLVGVTSHGAQSFEGGDWSSR